MTVVDERIVEGALRRCGAGGEARREVALAALQTRFVHCLKVVSSRFKGGIRFV